MDDQTLAPSLLIAMPQLLDPNFYRTVVLLTHHDEQGTFGLVLNRPTEITSMEICRALEVTWGGESDAVAHWGGPVQPNTGWMLFGDGLDLDHPEVTQLGAGLSFAGSLEAMCEVATAPPEHAQLFLGYAGWGSGQIESEMAQGAWLSAGATPELVFEVPADAMWNHVLQSIGVDPSSLVATPGIH